jgi:hypothetical protein
MKQNKQPRRQAPKPQNETGVAAGGLESWCFTFFLVSKKNGFSGNSFLALPVAAKYYYKPEGL